MNVTIFICRFQVLTAGQAAVQTAMRSHCTGVAARATRGSKHGARAAAVSMVQGAAEPEPSTRSLGQGLEG